MPYTNEQTKAWFTWITTCREQHKALCPAFMAGWSAALASQLVVSTQGAWHDAVLAECALVEGAYDSTDPAKTLNSLIGWHVSNARAPVSVDAGELRRVLQGLCDDQMDYIRLNNLSGAENNHWMLQARAALSGGTGQWGGAGVEAGELPPLPRSSLVLSENLVGPQFNALEMRAYATEAVRADRAARPAPQVAQAAPLDEGTLRAMRSTARESQECETQHWWILFARAIEARHGVLEGSVQAVPAIPEAELWPLLPGGAYYLDPPDGGDVPLIEQLRRMARDAASWRAQAAPAEPVGYVNRDDLDNMLDDRTAEIQGTPSGWRKTALYLAPPAPTPSPEAAAPSAVAGEPDGLLHDDGYFTWRAGVRPKNGMFLNATRVPFFLAPPSLPERDSSRPAEAQGLFRKFEVTRTDGSSMLGGKHHGCDYFVLDVTHDQHARPALSAYVDAVCATHPALAEEMRARYQLATPPEAAAPSAVATEQFKRTRAKTLLALLWRKYDAAGTSMGRTYEAVLLEAAIALLGVPDDADMRLLDADPGDFVDQTRTYLSRELARSLGFQDATPPEPPPPAPPALTDDEIDAIAEHDPYQRYKSRDSRIELRVFARAIISAVTGGLHD